MNLFMEPILGPGGQSWARGGFVRSDPREIPHVMNLSLGMPHVMDVCMEGPHAPDAVETFFRHRPQALCRTPLERFFDIDLMPYVENRWNVFPTIQMGTFKSECVHAIYD